MLWIILLAQNPVLMYHEIYWIYILILGWQSWIQGTLNPCPTIFTKRVYTMYGLENIPWKFIEYIIYIWREFCNFELSYLKFVIEVFTFPILVDGWMLHVGLSPTVLFFSNHLRVDIWYLLLLVVDRICLQCTMGSDPVYKDELCRGILKWMLTAINHVFPKRYPRPV